MGKTGLIVEGGGMKCAYSAGILDKFLDDSIAFDYCIGVSAGAANTLSYLAGQRGRNLRFYTVHLDDPRYLSVRSLLRTGNLFGLQYIYGTLTNSDGADPIDYDAIMKNPAEFYMPATDALTGRAAYFPSSTSCATTTVPSWRPARFLRSAARSMSTDTSTTTAVLPILFRYIMP